MPLRGTPGKHNDLTVRCVFFSGEQKGWQKPSGQKKLLLSRALPRNALNKVVRAELQNQSVIWEEAAFLNEIPALALATGRELILSL